jgi:hypothetical protein
LTVLILAALVAGGCGLEIQQPDLFLLTRTGGGSTKTLLVNSAGTVRCNGTGTRPVPDKLLLQARNLTARLQRDARHHLRVASGPDSFYHYRVKVRGGTIVFPDTAARRHPELAQLELLAVKLTEGPCTVHDVRTSGT